jgi:hypothetical protein
VEDGKGYSIIGYITRSRFGPLAMLALGQKAEDKTERISRSEALFLGEKMEKAFVAMNGGKRKK